MRTSLSWTLIHDPSPSVRIESIYAFKNLGYLENDTGVRDWLLTMIQQDESDTVRRVLEFVLVEMGVLLPAAVDLSNDSRESSHSEAATAAFAAAILTRIPAHLSLPYPHLLTGRSKDEVDIYLRDSLIEDKEALEVIQKVKHLAAKDKVIEQVLYLDRNSGVLPKVQVDLDMNKTFNPDLKGIHDAHKKKKGQASVG